MNPRRFWGVALVLTVLLMLVLVLVAQQKTPLTGPMSKARWVGLFVEAGLSEADMLRWHRDFERLAPDKHQAFLALLNLSETEITGIRAWSTPAPAHKTR